MPRGVDVYDLVNRILDGNLAETLMRWRDEGMTNIDIAFQLRADHKIRISHETVRRWLKQIDDEAAAKAGEEVA